MAARKFICVSNGRVANTYYTATGAPPGSVGNWIEVTLDVDLPSVVGHTYDSEAQTFGGVAPAPRMISRADFIDRFPIPLQLALERIASSGNSVGAMLVRIFTRRLEAGTADSPDKIDLASPALEAALLQLKTYLVADGAVPGFEDEAAAVATITALLS